MPEWEQESDERLLASTGRDAGAFGAFYRRWEQPVLAYFRRRVPDAELAADLTAEVFAAALVSARRFKPGDAPAAAWLFGIAQHVLAKSRRRGQVRDRARRRLGMEPIELVDDELARIDRLGSGDGVLAMLEALPADQRAAVRARVLDERGYDEIAASLRCSEAVVRKRVSRGLARLRDALGDEPA